MHHHGRQPCRATLRVDLPDRAGGIRYARAVADYLAHDTSAASVLFAVYTSEAQKPGQPKPHPATIAALTYALAERGMTIRDGLLVGDETLSQYGGDPQDGMALPLTATQSSQINAEFVYRIQRARNLSDDHRPAAHQSLGPYC
ncbi:DUF4192 family protein [Arthrobacter sp. ISL-69]|uniref:DUF4192 family protein n=1 Tax=Arthrobacter sp. ISL-69 TaxID=2819113 RepID=UPI0037BFE13B